MTDEEIRAVIEKEIDKRFGALAAKLRETALQHGPVVAKALDLIAGELAPKAEK